MQVSAYVKIGRRWRPAAAGRTETSPEAGSTKYDVQGIWHGADDVVLGTKRGELLLGNIAWNSVLRMRSSKVAA